MRHLLTLFLLTSALAAAQGNSYSIIIEQPAKGALFDIVEDADGVLSSVGTIDTPPQQKKTTAGYTNAFDYLSSVRSSSGEHMALVRVDQNAQTLLNQTLTLPYISRAEAVLPIDNGYLIGGESQDGRLALVHVGFDGTLHSERRFGTTATERISRLIALRDGGVLVIGSSMSNRNASDPLYSQGLGKNDIYLARFDKNSNLKWSKKYGTTDDDAGIDAVEAADGSIVVLATKMDNGTRYAVVMRLHETGDTLWTKVLPAPVKGAYDLLQLRDRSFLVSLGVLNRKNSEQVRLVNFDLHEHILRDKTIASPESRILYELAERSDNTLAGAGVAQGGKHVDTDALVMRLDAGLTPLWERRFGNRNSDAFHALSVLNDGTFAMVGTTTPSVQESSYMWIVKLHEDGSLALKSSDASSIYDALSDALSKEIDAGEISISRDLTISLHTDGLYFKTGVYRLNGAQERFLNRFGPKLFKALQPFQPAVSQLLVNGHTSSEWESADYTAGYLKNMELSSKRAFSVLSHLFSKPDTKPYRHWLTKTVQNNGHAYSHVVNKLTPDGKLSRRVDFKIVLK